MPVRLLPSTKGGAHNGFHQRGGFARQVAVFSAHAVGPGRFACFDLLESAVAEQAQHDHGQPVFLQPLFLGLAARPQPRSSSSSQ